MRSSRDLSHSHLSTSPRAPIRGVRSPSGSASTSTNRQPPSASAKGFGASASVHVSTDAQRGKDASSSRRDGPSISGNAVDGSNGDDVIEKLVRDLAAAAGIDLSSGASLQEAEDVAASSAPAEDAPAPAAEAPILQHASNDGSAASNSPNRQNHPTIPTISSSAAAVAAALSPPPHLTQRHAFVKRSDVATAAHLRQFYAEMSFLLHHTAASVASAVGASKCVLLAPGTNAAAVGQQRLMAHPSQPFFDTAATEADRERDAADRGFSSSSHLASDSALRSGLSATSATATAAVPSRRGKLYDTRRGMLRNRASLMAPEEDGKGEEEEGRRLDVHEGSGDNDDEEASPSRRHPRRGSSSSDDDDSRSGENEVKGSSTRAEEQANTSKSPAAKIDGALRYTIDSSGLRPNMVGPGFVYPTEERRRREALQKQQQQSTREKEVSGVAGPSPSPSHLFNSVANNDLFAVAAWCAEDPSVDCPTANDTGGSLQQHQQQQRYGGGSQRSFLPHDFVAKGDGASSASLAMRLNVVLNCGANMEPMGTAGGERERHNASSSPSRTGSSDHPHHGAQSNTGHHSAAAFGPFAGGSGNSVDESLLPATRRAFHHSALYVPIELDASQRWGATASAGLAATAGGTTGGLPRGPVAVLVLYNKVDAMGHPSTSDGAKGPADGPFFGAFTVQDESLALSCARGALAPLFLRCWNFARRARAQPPSGGFGEGITTAMLAATSASGAAAGSGSKKGRSGRPVAPPPLPLADSGNSHRAAVALGGRVSQPPPTIFIDFARLRAAFEDEYRPRLLGTDGRARFVVDFHGRSLLERPSAAAVPLLTASSADQLTSSSIAAGLGAFGEVPALSSSARAAASAAAPVSAVPMVVPRARPQPYKSFKEALIVRVGMLPPAEIASSGGRPARHFVTASATAAAAAAGGNGSFGSPFRPTSGGAAPRAAGASSPPPPSLSSYSQSRPTTAGTAYSYAHPPSSPPPGAAAATASYPAKDATMPAPLQLPRGRIPLSVGGAYDPLLADQYLTARVLNGPDGDGEGGDGDGEGEGAEGGATGANNNNKKRRGGGLVRSVQPAGGGRRLFHGHEHRELVRFTAYATAPNGAGGVMGVALPLDSTASPLFGELDDNKRERNGRPASSSLFPRKQSVTPDGCAGDGVLLPPSSPFRLPTTVAAATAAGASASFTHGEGGLSPFLTSVAQPSASLIAVLDAVGPHTPIVPLLDYVDRLEHVADAVTAALYAQHAADAARRERALKGAMIRAARAEEQVARMAARNEELLRENITLERDLATLRDAIAEAEAVAAAAGGGGGGIESRNGQSPSAFSSRHPHYGPLFSPSPNRGGRLSSAASAATPRPPQPPARQRGGGGGGSVSNGPPLAPPPSSARMPVLAQTVPLASASVKSRQEGASSARLSSAASQSSKQRPSGQGFASSTPQAMRGVRNISGVSGSGFERDERLPSLASPSAPLLLPPSVATTPAALGLLSGGGVQPNSSAAVAVAVVGDTRRASKAAGSTVDSFAFRMSDDPFTAAPDMPEWGREATPSLPAAVPNAGGRDGGARSSSTISHSARRSSGAAVTNADGNNTCTNGGDATNEGGTSAVLIASDCEVPSPAEGHRTSINRWMDAYDRRRLQILDEMGL